MKTLMNILEHLKYFEKVVVSILAYYVAYRCYVLLELLIDYVGGL